MTTALVEWFSKKQSTVEKSVFGAEFVTLKQGTAALRVFRYKLWIMGITISGSSYSYGDNMSVVHNTLRPELVLREESNSVCCHAICESETIGK